jgi:iron complex outermembrane recepter protein
LLTVEPTGGIISSVFPTGTDAGNNCATSPLAAQVQFAGGVCATNNILKVTRRSINGAGLRNDGVDVVMDYTFDNVGGGSLVVGASGTWIHSYETETLRINGVTFEQGFDGVGFLNQGTSLYALPEWRAQGYLDFAAGIHSVRWTTNWVDQYRDQRDGVIRDGVATASIYNGTTQNGRVIDSSFIHNVTYRVELPFNTTLMATVENLTDEDPSFARLELSYDPLTGFPLGRTFKLGFRTSFE